MTPEEIEQMQEEHLIEVGKIREEMLSLFGKHGEVAKSTVYRWTTRGVKGHRIRSFKLGQKKMTSREEVQRFLKRLNA